MSGVFRSSVSGRAMFAAVLFVALLSTALASPAWAKSTFTVNSTGDGADADTADDVCDVDANADGEQCTLRAAIEQANETANTAAEPDEVHFGISGGGPHTISPGSALPTVAEAVVIDGYKQPGASPATAGAAATLKIELDGSAGGGENGITIGSGGGGSTVRGLAINRFSSAGIHTLSDGNTVEGNHIGTNVAGDEKLPNGFVGVLIDGGFDTAERASNDNVIGGTEATARNVISGNATHGVWIRGTVGEADSASGNEVLGNYIGTDASGAERLANGDPGNGFGNSSGSGVEIDLASGNTVGGTTAGARNILSGNGAYGVSIIRVSSNNKVQGNYIGTDVFGSDSITNELDGVRIENRDGRPQSSSSGNVIGGTVEGAGNVISGNNSNTSFFTVSNPNSGVIIRGPGTSGNKIQGNFIGTDKDGAAPLGNSERNEPDRVFFTGNGQFGVRILNAPGNIIGGTDADDGASDGDVKARNVISGNRGVTDKNGVTGTGLKIEGPSATGNKVQGNYIGTDVSGTEAVRNILDGVVVEDATNNLIGGAQEGARNVISGNLYDGVAIHEESSGNKVQGNYIGVDATGGVALPNATGLGVPSSGVTVTAPGNIIGGAGEGEGNVISGNGKAGVEGGGGNGVIIVAPGSDPGAASGNVIKGNFIGTDATGETALKNGRCGIAIRATGTIVGGAEDGAGNVISANHNDGIEVVGETSSGNEIQGNRFGTDVSGTEDLGNGGSGVDIIGASGNTVGGTADGAGNLLSGNGNNGVEISEETATGNVIQGNRMGTDATGSEPLGNDFSGVTVSNAHDNTIGGTEDGAGNFISGNVSDGVQMREGASGNVVQGNLAGTDASGTEALQNGNSGIALTNAHDNTIGGTAAGAGNVLSGNREDGVLMTDAASGNKVLGNFIGADETGEMDLGNARYGIVALASARDNTIGGSEEAARNAIAFNGEAGVRILESASTGNAILRNSIHSNGGLGIDLGAVGVNANDVRDPDTGPNGLQNHPIITAASTSGGSTSIVGSLDSAPRKAFVIRFFSNSEADTSGFGEGKMFLGQKSVTTNSSGDASFDFDFTGSLSAGEFVTATATSASGDTSEFSNAEAVIEGTKPEPPKNPNACTITGTDRGDVLRGTPGRDVICGLGGDDALYGLGDDDILRGDSGDDLLLGGAGDDRLIGGSGRDLLRGEGGNDRLDARDGIRGNDVADGGPGRDACAADGRDVKRNCP